MPWHVIVVNYKKPDVPGEPDPLIDKVFRDEDYPDNDALLAAVALEEEELKRHHPYPDYRIVHGSGPERNHELFDSFVVWLLRD